ncbi:MAG: DUF368 domain-containing protein [Pseudomonadales bacterium]|nr:DUF368 domain-containing protein [Pseudomonadales bacterium]
MGAADVVPGVSGGTVAFITGIYEELLSSIKSVNPKTAMLLFSEGPKAFWSAINGNFLAALLTGIITSFLSLAHLITWLMAEHPLLLWSFFFGLVAASAVYIAKELDKRAIGNWLMLLVGFVVAFWITSTQPAEVEATNVKIFFAGAIAICAMILPGISGSFILLLLGLYSVILTAVKSLDVAVVLVFIAGCLVGLLSFVHLLSWLLKRFRAATIALLTGFLLGSLNALWPWKHVLTTYTSSKGIIKPLTQENVLPEQFHLLTQQEPLMLGCISLAVAGMLLVLALEWVSRSAQTDA